jgi:2-dehydro-3-deoxyphosphooctonate aldolase (KDO 8-P synthase)
MSKEFRVGDVSIGGRNPFVLIAGPCVIESERSALRHARYIKEITRRLGIAFIFKSSYDKANRSSVDAYRGPGLKKGLKILRRVKEEIKIPVTSDIHCKTEVRAAGSVLDLIQIPAFLCRQTDLLTASAKTKKPINIKKGQFLAPWDIGNIIKKIKSAGNDKIMITERGSSFGYNNLVSDFRSILIMKKSGYPVCYDASHSVQKPGGLGVKSGGEAEFIPALSKAAIACAVDALFIEIHENPKRALSDGPNMLKLSKLSGLLKQLKAISEVV